MTPALVLLKDKVPGLLTNQSMLVEFFDSEADDLRKEIRKAVNTENVVTATQNTLNHIRSEARNAEITDEVTLDRLIAHLKSASVLIVSASEVKVWKKEQTVQDMTLIGSASSQPTIKIIQIIILVGLAFFFWFTQPEYYLFLVGATLFVAVLEAVLYFFNLRHEHKEVKKYKKKKIPKLDEVRYDVLVDPDEYIAQFRQLIIASDKLLPLMNAKNLEPVGNLIEGDKALLELFQGMVEAADNKDQELAMMNSKRVAGLLSKYSIKLIYYDGENDDLFEFFPNLKDEDVHTIYPALVKDKKTISMGRVVTPHVTHK